MVKHHSKVCKEINSANQEWDSFTPKNRLQTRMMDVIRRIEEREKGV